MKSRSSPALIGENIDLRARLEEAEETLRAIRGGEIDALYVQTAAGPYVYTLQGQDAEESRRRGEMLAQISEAIVAVDNEKRITYFNAAAEKLYGVAASEALGRESSAIYTLRWLHQGDEEAALMATRQGGEWCGETNHIRRDGRILNVEASVTVLRDSAGQAAGMLTVIRDIIIRKQAAEKLRISEKRYRRIFECAHDGVIILDAGTRKIIDANPFITNLLGYLHAELVGKELYEIGLLKDETASKTMIQELNRTNQVRYEDLPLESRTGQHQQVEVIANLYDEGHHAVIQCNIRDITERKRTEDHVKMLMAEINHRAKNLLTVVQAVANLTAKEGPPATFAARLSERIIALSAGQDLLVRNQWQGVELLELIAAQLDHFKDLIGTRVMLDGPAAELTPDAAQGIGMALHELGTNAAKYGALSNNDGQVFITWQIAAGTTPKFSMSWSERGGPKVVSPTRAGFGQTVIGRMAQSAVQGVAEIHFPEAGVSWNLCAPAENVLTKASVRAL